MRYYRFTNSTPSKLGKEPLPDGQVKAFRLISEDKLYAFVGRTSVKYIPINETVELELGNDREVLVKPTLMNWEKTDVQFDNHGNVKGWTIKETWEVELQNSKEIDVVLDMRRNFAGDWSIDHQGRLREGGCHQGEVPGPAQTAREAEVHLRSDHPPWHQCDEVDSESRTFLLAVGALLCLAVSCLWPTPASMW